MIKEKIIELYKKTATALPEDIVKSLEQSKESGLAKSTVATILENIKIAQEKSVPICQDTGTPIFYVKRPKNVSELKIKEEIITATKEATVSIPLRPNAADPLTGENTDNNVGNHIPVIHFEEWEKDFTEISLMLKGGGSENISQTYKLPDESINAERTVEGIKKCVIDAVFKAQGKGCPPYIVGVGIGGTYDSSAGLAKKQLLRKLDDINSNPILKIMEQDLLKDINSMEIGPMGLSGNTTALAVKADFSHRNPSTFFVSVSFGCWATRRGKINV